MIPKGPIAKATLRTSVVLGIRLTAQAGVLLGLAHLLGPEHFGAYAAIAALAVLMSTLSTFGTHLTVLRDLSQDPSRRDTVLAPAFGTTALCGSTLLVLYLLVSFSWVSLVDLPLLVLVCVGLSELVLQPFLALIAVERQAHGQIARSQLLLTLPQVLRLPIIAIVWQLETTQPLTAYAVGHLVAIVLALGVALTTTKALPPAPSKWRVQRRSEWIDSGSYAVLNLTATAPSELDKAIAARLLPLGTVGIYAAASRIVIALATPVVAMMLAALPRLFRTQKHEDPRLLKYLFAASAAYGVLAGTTIWLAAPIIENLFDERFLGITQNIRWLAFAVPGFCLRIAACNALMSSEHPWLRVMVELLAVLLLTTLALILTSADFPQGLAMALTFSEWSASMIGWGLLGYFASIRGLSSNEVTTRRDKPGRIK